MKTLKFIIFKLCGICPTAILFCISLICCQTFSSEKLVYSLCHYEISENQLNFEIKNTSEKVFSSFTLYVQFETSNSENTDTDVMVIEKEFFTDLKPGDIDYFSINLSEMDFLPDGLSEETDETGLENSIYIQKIYISKIKFDDETAFSDKYGTWSF